MQGMTKTFKKILLQQRLSAGNTDGMGIVIQSIDLAQDILKAQLFILALAVTDGSRRIAPDTMHIALKKTHKHLRRADVLASPWMERNISKILAFIFDHMSLNAHLEFWLARNLGRAGGSCRIPRKALIRRYSMTRSNATAPLI